MLIMTQMKLRPEQNPRRPSPKHDLPPYLKITYFAWDRVSLAFSLARCISLCLSGKGQGCIQSPSSSHSSDLIEHVGRERGGLVTGASDCSVTREGKNSKQRKSLQNITCARKTCAKATARHIQRSSERRVRSLDRSKRSEQRTTVHRAVNR